MSMSAPSRLFLSLVWILSILAVLAVAPAARAQCPVAQNVASENRGCSVRLTWQSPSGTPLLWQIWRNTVNSTSGATQVGSVAGNILRFDDTSPVRGTQFYYFIRPQPIFGTCSGSDSSIVPGRMLPLNVWPPQFSSSICGQTGISWPAFPDATSYDVYRGDRDGSNIIVVASVGASVLNCVDTTGIPGKEYLYAVAPRVSCDSVSSYGAYSWTTVGAPSADAASVSDSASVGQSASLEFRLNNGGLSPQIQLFRNGTPISLSNRMTFVAGFLTISNLQLADAGRYTLRYTTGCGTISQDAVLAVTTTCPADFNGSGAKDVQDIFDFLAAWFAPCP